MSEQRLNVVRDLLDHRFYRPWVEGGLSIHELQDYACQYAHVVAIYLCSCGEPHLAQARMRLASGLTPPKRRRTYDCGRSLLRRLE